MKKTIWMIFLTTGNGNKCKRLKFKRKGNDNYKQRNNDSDWMTSNKSEQ